MSFPFETTSAILSCCHVPTVFVLQELLSKHGLLNDYLTKSTQLLSFDATSARSSLMGALHTQRQQHQQQQQQRGWLAGCCSFLASCVCGSSAKLPRRNSGKIFCESAAGTGGHNSMLSSAAGTLAPNAKSSKHISGAGSKSGKKQIWEPGPGEMQPLKMVWSPLAVLLLLAYLGAAGYYLFVRFVTAWDLGNQTWWVERHDYCYGVLVALCCTT
jgi:hypothetical protein